VSGPAATKLAQYGIDCLVLDRWEDVYPQPRAVHLDDEIYRLLAGLGIADEFALVLYASANRDEQEWTDLAWRLQIR
jgi:2-polyprenyl-6-methoxyphenol hydroxylase-like FAD-dependent oxidoreductase